MHAIEHNKIISLHQERKKSHIYLIMRFSIQDIIRAVFTKYLPLTFQRELQYVWNFKKVRTKWASIVKSVSQHRWKISSCFKLWFYGVWFQTQVCLPQDKISCCSVVFVAKDSGLLQSIIYQICLEQSTERSLLFLDQLDVLGTRLAE